MTSTDSRDGDGHKRIKKWGVFGMSETTSEVTATAGEPNEQGKEAPKEFTAITSQEDFDKAIQARIARERAKIPADYEELKANAAKFNEWQESQKSEAERTAERLAAAEKRAGELEKQNARLDVIAAHQIPADYHDLIQGDDEASLSATAEKVRALLAVSNDGGRASFVIPDEGGAPSLALNSDGMESALRKALGIA